MFKLFYSVPKNIIKEYELYLFPFKTNSKYYFIDFIIENNQDDMPKIRINTFDNQVRIIIEILDKNKLNYIEMQKFDKKYSNQNIFMSGYGIGKKISMRNWEKIDKNEFERYINEIIKIIENEQFEY